MKYMEAAKKLKDRSGYVRKDSWAPGVKIVVTDGSITSGRPLALSGGDILDEDFDAYDLDGNKI